MAPVRHSDLEALAARHAEDEAEEATRDLVDARRPLSVRRPPGGKLVHSEAWLTRLYRGGRIVREKKPAVFDHLRSIGPWFVSVDERALSVLDAMSQTATLPAGFSPDGVVRGYVDGAFGDALVAGGEGLPGHPAVDAFAARLRELVPGLPFVSFTSSGAEACEKAFALCRRSARSESRRKLLAFEGSFHGRTLLALQASYSPAKRAPFEIAGTEVTFVPFPVWTTPNEAEPAEPPGFRELLADGRIDELRARAEGDPLLTSELRVLAEVHRHLATDSFFAVAVEPMQSEGGDRHATARFFRALRLLTRHHQVPLVMDEVQTGFGLGGTFVWHSRFGLVDAGGRPDGPDCVTFAKRAQVGVVMSRFEDPEPTSAHPASLVRGLLHLEHVAGDGKLAVIEPLVKQRLAEVAARFPALVLAPRATGYAMAFDLPSAAHLDRYLAQRFFRGAIVFGAGTQTVRYRLSSAWGPEEVDLLFEAIGTSLAWLAEHPEDKPPEWEDGRPLERPRPAMDVETRVRQVGHEEAERMLAAILELETRAYEPARQDTPERLRTAFDHPDGIVVVAEAKVGGEWTLVGSALGAPLEVMHGIDGPDRDPMRGRDNTLYSVALTVDPAFQGHGLGKRLKRAQLRAARALKRADGRPRYLHATGRNRVGRAHAMQSLALSLGAYEVARFRGQYGEPDGEALYYRLPLGPFVVDAPEPPPADDLDLSAGLARPFADPPASLKDAAAHGLLFGPAVNKITLCNYVTPAVVRAVEWVSALTPDLPHLYLTSSRDEAFDKAVRLLRWHRKEGAVALGLEGGYVGHTSAAARSLSDPRVHRQGPGYFDRFRRVPHPAAGIEATREALAVAVEEAGGAAAVLGLFVEPVQERTGRVLPDAFFAELAAFRERTGIPVVLVETASAMYRAGDGPFFSSALDFVPDALAWWAGGQIGFLHVRPEMWVDKPLTFVSTWDGDELSLVRVHHQLRAARLADVEGRSRALDRLLWKARPLEVRGAGLYRVIDAGPRAAEVERALAVRGIRVRRFPNDCIALVPPLDVRTEVWDKVADALAEVVTG